MTNEEKMAVNEMNDGMGKKIVEALKMQTADHSDGEVFVNEAGEEIASEPAVDNSSDLPVHSDTVSAEGEEPISLYDSNEKYSHSYQSDLQAKIQSQLQFQAATQSQPFSGSQSFVDNVFQQSLAQNLGSTFAQELPDDFNYPANVAVLKQLIAKLPTGVSRQTGALIIKQTMEALGISMGSVLQEAKQVQEALVSSSKECQNSIVEYRKQIGILESKSQQYQKQAAIMNDIIHLFIQTR